MKRNLQRRHGPSAVGRTLEAVNNGMVGAAMLACTLLAFSQPPLAIAGRTVQAAVVRLEGLVVTPRGTYGANAWAARQLVQRTAARLAEARPLPRRQCALPAAPARPRTQTC